jgi:hypothetical protein
LLGSRVKLTLVTAGAARITRASAAKSIMPTPPATKLSFGANGLDIVPHADYIYPYAVYVVTGSTFERSLSMVARKGAKA